ncbi:MULTISPECIES: RodZ domain-containing protein [Halomonadaceae]|uniref:Transcriptional regulator n=1 Tax=Vreelandella hamiltonii TaxID=502829 RepID=A0A8H9M2F7_9GAMM|nr:MULTISPECIES: RodZ domain-containing protein [Halomonas]KHJ50836.1 cytoskeleton protein rodZ [Halomonas hydrothermalis]GHD55333.1 transcriptional regulator [Halomonas hamiltonii]
MSETQLHDSVTSTSTAGELLSRQREALGVPIVDAARALNLRTAVVEGLEKDNYEEIPVTAYRRGYLRAYAKYLGLDDKLVLDAYQARHGSSETERKIAPVAVTRPPSKVGAWLFKLVTLLVIVGLIGVTVAWWQSRGGSEPPSMGTSSTLEEDAADSATPPPAEPMVEPDPVVIPPMIDEPQVSMEDEDASTDADASTEPASDVADASAEPVTDVAEAQAPEAPAEDAAPEPVANPNLLELTFNEQSWTEIFDANNQRVFVGLQTPGTTASVEGTPPFRLTIGNATGVELRYQGDTVNLAQRAGANNVARFTLGE